MGCHGGFHSLNVLVHVQFMRVFCSARKLEGRACQTSLTTLPSASPVEGIRERLVRRLLEEQDKVFRCYYAAKWGGQKEQGTGGEETGQMQLGEEVSVTCRDMGGE